MSLLHSNIEHSWQWETNTDHINDPLAAIYNEGQWSLNKVSALNNLQYNRVKFKQYASNIRQALVKSVSDKSSLKYDVQFDHLPLLKYCEDDADAIRINVATTSNSNKTKVVYTCMLLSWGLKSNLEGAIHLPYLLDRGQRKLADAVKTSLQKMFDCNIKPFNFTQYQLLMFGFNFVEAAPSRSTDPFVISYTRPHVKDKIDCRWNVGDVHIMCNGLKNEVNNTLEFISLVYQTLRRQLLHTIKFDASALDICKITLPKAEVKSDGVVKMKSPEVVNSVFQVLNEIICHEFPIEC